MPLIAPFAQGAFDPEALRILETAFNAAWKTLSSSSSDLTVESRAASARELLASRIVEMAERGVRDPRRLADDALLHLATSIKAR
jgi:hypothetical protein